MFSAYFNAPCKPSAPPTPVSLAVSGQKKRLCLVSDHSCAALDLVARLSAGGWMVTLLDIDTTAYAEEMLFDYMHVTGLYSETNQYLPLRSLCVYHWLRAKNFDVVLFHQDFGVGYYSCVAKQLGLAFADAILTVMPSYSRERILEEKEMLPRGRTDIEDDFMERQTVRRSDAVLFADQADAAWYQNAQWELPEQTALYGDVRDVKFGDWLRKNKTVPKKPEIFISVCLATRNRPQMLRQAIDSLVAQSYQNFELIVIDDGSDDPQMAELQNEYAALFQSRGWRWIVQAQQGVKFTRNRVIELGRGTHFLFMDDDNIAYPDELERFALAATHSDADILTCILGMHPESRGAFPPTAFLPERNGVGTRPVGWTPVGACLALSVFVNCLGDTNSLFKREVFVALGGFHGSPEMISEDIELLTRAVIAGYRLEVIPEILLLYRRHEASRSMGSMVFKSHLETLRPIAALLPPSLRSLLLTTRREWYERHCERSQAAQADES